MTIFRYLGNIDPYIFLFQEHFELYSWREDFFYNQFGHYRDEKCSWFTDGADDSHSFDTIPYQVDDVKSDSDKYYIDILSDYQEI